MNSELRFYIQKVRHFVDKYESNNTGDGQTDRQKRTEVCTGKIYEFLRSNDMTPGVTEHWTLMKWVSRNVGYE